MCCWANTLPHSLPSFCCVVLYTLLFFVLWTIQGLSELPQKSLSVSLCLMSDAIINSDWKKQRTFSLFLLHWICSSILWPYAAWRTWNFGIWKTKPTLLAFEISFLLWSCNWNDCSVQTYDSNMRSLSQHSVLEPELWMLNVQHFLSVSVWCCVVDSKKQLQKNPGKMISLERWNRLLSKTISVALLLFWKNVTGSAVLVRFRWLSAAVKLCWKFTSQVCLMRPVHLESFGERWADWPSLRTSRNTCWTWTRTRTWRFSAR